MAESNYLKPCPLCAGRVSFCGLDTEVKNDDECDGCHYLICRNCEAVFDLSISVDPSNQVESLERLRELIKIRWNLPSNFGNFLEELG